MLRDHHVAGQASVLRTLHRTRAVNYAVIEWVLRRGSTGVALGVDLVHATKFTLRSFKSRTLLRTACEIRIRTLEQRRGIASIHCRCGQNTRRPTTSNQEISLKRRSVDAIKSRCFDLIILSTCLVPFANHEQLCLVCHRSSRLFTAALTIHIAVLQSNFNFSSSLFKICS